MSVFGGPSRRWRITDAALYLIGVAGLSASLTVLFLGMRAVMDVGGFCAEGGPYQIAAHCPDGALLMPLAIFSGLGSVALVAAFGSRLGGGYGAVAALAWPALFLSLGWNFLEYAIVPPAPMAGIQLGWLIPGVLFVVMGGVPLAALLPGRRLLRSAATASPPPDGTAEAAVSQVLADGEARYATQIKRARAQLLGDLVKHVEHERSSEARAAGLPHAALTASEDDLVSKLERLAALHRAGSLTYDEFQRAKAALLAAQG